MIQSRLLHKALAIVLSYGSMVAALVPQAAAVEKPNVVFILADDLGYSDLGCFGSAFHETPNIDRLAREGRRFTQAYSAGSVCSPTRSSIMTGKYPVRTGITDYIPGLSSDGHKLQTTRTKTQLALEEVTIGEALQAGGYQTFYAGKWHLGGKGFEPDSQGFEIYRGDRELENRAQDWQSGQRLTDAALEFLTKHDATRPFLMYLAFHEPHIPILEYPRHIERFQSKAKALVPASGPQEIAERGGRTRVVQDNPAYGSELAGLDEWVGRVLEGLDKTGLTKNTIVVFASDNGGLSTKAAPGPTSNQPLRAGKGWLYEGGIRVPLIIRGPGIAKPGTTCDAAVISTDLYPTLLELAGLPLRPAQHVDGASFAALLRGGAAPAARSLYWHYPHYHGSTWAPGGAIRDGDWKLIEFFEEGTSELYNVKTDLGERKNLASQHPEFVKTLQGKLAAWRTSAGAVMPQRNAAFGTDAPTAAKAKRRAKKSGQ